MLQLDGYQRVPSTILSNEDGELDIPTFRVAAESHDALVRKLERRAGACEARCRAGIKGPTGVTGFLVVEDEPHAVEDGWEATIGLLAMPADLVPKPPRASRSKAGENEKLRSIVSEMWEWQKNHQELLPEGLAERVSEVISAA